jgi:hypothetical protein
MLKRCRKPSVLEESPTVTPANALVAVAFANDAMLAKVFRKII